MIKFTDLSDKKESMERHDLSEKKENFGASSLSDSEVKSFWNDVFSENKANEFSYEEVFDRYESDFKFDFEVKDASISEVFSMFEPEKWNSLGLIEKAEVIVKFIDILCEKLGIDECPKLAFFEDDAKHCGFYDSAADSINLNTNIFNDPKEVVDTIAHESFHAYQNYRADKGETYVDELYKYNFDNYVSPQYDDRGHCVNIIEYQNQYVEAEARAFANLFEI